MCLLEVSKGQIILGELDTGEEDLGRRVELDSSSHAFLVL